MDHAHHVVPEISFHEPLENEDYQPILEDITTSLESSIQNLGQDLTMQIKEVWCEHYRNTFKESDDDGEGGEQEGGRQGEGDNDTEQDGEDEDKDEEVKWEQDPNVQKSAGICDDIIEKILKISQTKLAQIAETLHTNENEKKTHMRWHYDQKLNMCRVSHRLEREHYSTKSRVNALHTGEKMQQYYQRKMEKTNLELEQYKIMRQVQDKTLHESQSRLCQTEEYLKNTLHEYNIYKNVMEENNTKLKEEVKYKTKQEVWAHFKISHLKKIARDAEHQLCFRRKECTKKAAEIHELQSRLKTSIEIREGLERAFEKRASIRGRLDILQENNKLQRSKQCANKTEKRRKRACFTKGTQASLSNGAETKDQGIDTPPFYTDSLSNLQRKNEEIEHMLRLSNEKEEYATKQNEAYRRLVSGKGLAMILATKHRELSNNPKSMDAKILYNLTMPQGVLIEEAESLPQNDESDKKPKQTSKHADSSSSIPKLSELTSFKGITGNQIETGAGIRA